jgi:hypothetical protein
MSKGLQTIELDPVGTLECVYEDIVLWLNTFIAAIKDFPRPQPLPGIMTMSDAAVETFLRDADSNIRRM